MLLLLPYPKCCCQQKLLETCTGYEQCLQQIPQEAARLINAADGCVWIVSGDWLVRMESCSGGRLVQPPMGEARQRVPIGHGIAGMVAKEGEAVSLSEPYTDPQFQLAVCDAAIEWISC